LQQNGTENTKIIIISKDFGIGAQILHDNVFQKNKISNQYGRHKTRWNDWLWIK
jgi:hypothetical protein